MSAPDAAAGPDAFAHRAVHETLGRASDVDACAALVARTDNLLDQAIGHFRDSGAPIACRAGCNFCCHLRVMVYPHEVIALYRCLGARMSAAVTRTVRTRALANATEIRRREREGLPVTGVACALLVDGHCSAYAHRPSSCASYHSLAVQPCENALAPDGPTEIPQLEALRYTAGALEAGLEAGLDALQLEAGRVELNTALAALIRDPSLIARWRAGRRWPPPG